MPNYCAKKQADFTEWLKQNEVINFGTVMFRNGYSSKNDSMVARCSLRIGTGNTEWGAEDGKEYYIFGIGKYDIIEVSYDGA